VSRRTAAGPWLRACAWKKSLNYTFAAASVALDTVREQALSRPDPHPVSGTLAEGWEDYFKAYIQRVPKPALPDCEPGNYDPFARLAKACQLDRDNQPGISRPADPRRPLVSCTSRGRRIEPLQVFWMRAMGLAASETDREGRNQLL
jgi:hypothetical protein